MATKPVEQSTRTTYHYGRMIQDDYEGAKPWLWLSGPHDTQETATKTMLATQRSNPDLSFDIYISVSENTLYKVSEVVDNGADSPK